MNKELVKDALGKGFILRYRTIEREDSFNEDFWYRIIPLRQEDNQYILDEFGVPKIEEKLLFTSKRDMQKRILKWLDENNNDYKLDMNTEIVEAIYKNIGK